MPRKTTTTATTNDQSNHSEDHTNERTQEHTMGQSAFASRLAGLDGAFGQAAEEAANNFINKVPPATYDAVLESAIVTEAQSSGKLMVAWTFVITQGESAGEQLRIYQGLEDPDKLKYLAQNLRTMGVDMAGFTISADLEPTLAELTEAKPVAKILVKENNSPDGRKFQNTYIQKLLAPTQADYTP